MEQDYNVWFGKRLKEVMEHQEVTAKGLGERSGVGRMTISRILQGRYATAEEVKKIADALGITVERLKQKDVDLQIVSRESRPNPELEMALQEANYAVSVAIGQTETGLAYQLLGTAHYNLQQFENALEAYQVSFRHLQDSEEPKLVSEAYNSLMVTYVMIKDYDALNNLFVETEKVFQHNTVLLARWLHFKASYLAEYEIDYESALETFNRALDLFKQLGNRIDSGRIIGNLGDVCFRMYRYEQAKTYYEQLFDEYSGVEPQIFVDLLQYKDYVKTLICVGETDRARDLIEKRWDEAINFGHEKVTSLYLILREILHGDGVSAERILAMNLENEKLNLLASVLLAFAHYKKGEQGDGLKVFREMLSDHLVLE